MAYSVVLVLLVLLGFTGVKLANVRTQTVDEIYLNGEQKRDLIQTQRDMHDTKRVAKQDKTKYDKSQDKFVQGIRQAARDLRLEDKKKKDLVKIAQNICTKGDSALVVLHCASNVLCNFSEFLSALVHHLTPPVALITSCGVSSRVAHCACAVRRQVHKESAKGDTGEVPPFGGRWTSCVTAIVNSSLWATFCLMRVLFVQQT